MKIDSTDHRILAIDLGKFNSTSCLLDPNTGEVAFDTIPTDRESLLTLLDRRPCDRLVIEIGPSAGWIHDLALERGLEIQVANPAHEAWRWRGRRNKTDRADAAMLARLSAMGELPVVHVPDRAVRAWRRLIHHRDKIVGRITMVKNTIRATLHQEGLSWPSGKSGWTIRSLGRLREMVASPSTAVWKAIIASELRQLDVLTAELAGLEETLTVKSASRPEVALLQTIPGVGPRLAEAVVAILDDPRRFRSGSEVGAYAGLTPRTMQSGAMHRQSGISKRGDGLLRKLLTQVSWLGLRHNPWLLDVFRRVSRGMKSRRKIAVVAVARRLLVWCWGMLRSGTAWRPPFELPVAAEAA